MDTPDIDDNISDIEAVDSQDDEDQKIVPLNDNNDELNESR